MKDNILIIAGVAAVAASIVGYYMLPDLQQIVRVLIVVGGVIAGLALASQSEQGQSAWAFIKGANVERQKVVWPTRQEAGMVTLWVIILVIILGFVMWMFDALSFWAIYDLVLRVRNN